MTDEEWEPFAGGFARLIGMELVSISDTEVQARVAVRDELKQPMGLIDGGVYAALAEDMCSAGTHAVVSRDGRAAMGLSNQTSFLRPVTEGYVNARATARHAGRTTWVWEVDFTDDEGRLCALSRMTVAVR